MSAGGLNNQESGFCALTILSGQFSGTGSGTAPEVPENSILSKYYQFYTNLLNDQRLLTTAERLGFRINFIPHPTLFPCLDRFQIPPQVNVCGTGVTYRESFARNKLLVTDYSSVAFDFAYLRKPVLYCQYEKQTHYEKGYFDYELDGFGEVETDLEGTVNRIIEYMENGCKLKEK